jgi:hypothetical protein
MKLSGPVPPAGWTVDLNDYVLLSYDPYFGTEKHNDADVNPFAKDERYYSKEALPVCRTDAHSLKTMPHSASMRWSASKGRYLIAQRDIAAGEIVAMDTSVLTIVDDPKVFLYPPPAAVPEAEELRLRRESTQRLAKCIIQAASSLVNGMNTLVRSGKASLLCSLLVCWGDAELLPRGFRTRGVESIVDDLIRAWWQHGFSESRVESSENPYDAWEEPKASETWNDLYRTAQLLIKCIPSKLLAEVNSENGVLYGFFARIGLHNPVTLARLLSVVDKNSFNLHIPDLAERRGLFPFLRLFEHECRPSCTVMALDCPATHTYGATGKSNYDTVYQTSQRRMSLWESPTTTLIFQPSVIVITSMRNIAQGEPLSIGYLPTAYMCQAQRVRELKARYDFDCHCRWCEKEPDLARGFRCQKCDFNVGVVCPVGDGKKLDLWECLQCGHRPPFEDIQRMLDAEEDLRRVKADKTSGMAKLLGNRWVHYTHHLVFNKIDHWSEIAWKKQEAQMCVEYVEALQKCVRRVLDPCDVGRAQYHEFLGQVNHALGNAHTARYEYFLAFQIRVRAGQRYAHWTRKTRFMAAEKSLVDFLDSK